MANQDRYYHHVHDIDSAKEAIRQLTDSTYELRDQIDSHKKTIESMQKSSSTKSFGDNIQGIKVIATTDPSSLQNGMTIRYNSGTGQFEFGM